jgi:thioredoxin reductase
MRFPLEVVHAIREAVGEDFPFGVRVCMHEYTPWGYGVDEGKRIAAAFADTGEIDYINCDAGSYSSFHMEIPPMEVPPGYSVDLGEAVKEVTDLPVIAFGRVNGAMQAERMLARGQADFIGMVRGLLCEPEFVNKVRENRVEDIRRCIACNDGCIYQVMQSEPIRCVHNPAGGREAHYGIGTLKSAKIKKRVVVVGGGPAGLKMAEIAAKRGHSVSLYEEKGEFGGQLRIAARIPGRKEVLNVVRHLMVQIEKLKVDVHLRHKMDAKAIRELEADITVLATGSSPALSDIPGADQPHVLNVWEVLMQEKPAGENVLVFDITRRWHGLGTAEYLAGGGCRVSLATPAYYAGDQIPPGSLTLAYQFLFSRDAAFLPHSELVRVQGTSVTLENVHSGKREELHGVDTVVMSVGSRSNRALYDELKGMGGLFMLGDAVAPRHIQQVILEAEELARAL